MRLFIALVLAGSGASALAQPSVPTIDPDPIVVVGIRDGSTVGMVDYDKVWRRCAECKRALAKLTALSKPFHVKKGQVARDARSYKTSVGEHTRWRPPVDITKGEATSDMNAVHAGNLLRQLPDQQRKDTDELETMRFDMEKLSASFLAQLEPHARAAVEEERAIRNLPAVFDRNGKPPAAKVREVELTDAVVRRLDSKNFTIVLPDPPTNEQ